MGFWVKWPIKNPCIKCGKPIKIATQLEPVYATYDRRKKPAPYWHVNCAKPWLNVPAGFDDGDTDTATTDSEAKDQPTGFEGAEFSPTSPTPTATPTTPHITLRDNENMSNPDALQVLAEALTPHLNITSDKVEGLLAEIETKVNDKLSSVDGMIADAIAKQTRTLRIETKPGCVISIEQAHENFSKLAYYASKRMSVYLHGESGSGKSHAAKQLADVLGLKYGYISLTKQTMPSALIGYMDANGNYVKTTYYDCFKNGGLFNIDEIDNASLQLLTSFNSTLANGYGAFPCGVVQRHPDFICVVTGNTPGTGATKMFPDRTYLDIAFRSRFAFIKWDIDSQLEENITLAINPDAKPWLDWTRKAREYCYNNKLSQFFITPRASYLGAELLIDSGLTIREIADAAAFMGAGSDVIDNLLMFAPLPEIVAGKPQQQTMAASAD